MNILTQSLLLSHAKQLPDLLLLNDPGLYERRAPWQSGYMKQVIYLDKIGKAIMDSG